jgi:hypothetical protein
MAAQLPQCLKHKGFTHFRLISYKCPVAQYSHEGHVYLDLRDKGGAWGVRADAPENLIYTAIWH